MESGNSTLGASAADALSTASVATPTSKISMQYTRQRPRQWQSGSMSEPAPLGYAEGGSSAERKKDRAKNVSIPRPGGDCAGQRQEGEQSEVARLGVHFPPLRKGQRLGCPFLCARVDGLEPLIPLSPAAG